MQQHLGHNKTFWSWSILYLLTFLILGTNLSVNGKTDGHCNTCDSTSWIFDSIGRNLTDDELAHTFVKFCTQDYNGSNQLVCTHMANTLVPIFRTISSKNFCNTMHVCGKTSPLQNVVTGASCDVCQEIVSQVQQTLSNKTLVNEIEAKALQFCGLLPTNSDQCKDFVKAELLSIIKLIENEPALSFCSSIMFCNSNSLKYDSLLPIVNLRHFESKSNKKPDQTIIIRNNVNSLQMSMGTKCLVCDDVMKWVIKFLQQNSTEQAIENAIDKVCPMFYRSNELKRVHCDHLVTEYTQQLINLIVEDVHPDMICNLLNFCSSSKVLKISLKESNKPVLSSTNGNQIILHKQLIETTNEKAGPGCVLCIQVFRYIYKHLNGSETTEEIEQALDHGCNVIFDRINHNKLQLDKCKKMVANNSELFVKLIKSNAGPTLSCLAVGMCLTPAKKHLLVESTEETPYKQMCEKISQNALNSVKNNRIETRTWAVLSEVCSKTFSSENERSDCTVYVHNHQKQLQKALMKAQSTSELCELVSNYDESTEIQQKHSTQPVSTLQGQTCDLCKIFLGFVYKDLKQNKTQAGIIKVFDKVCEKYVPSKHKEQCYAYVQAYTIDLINAIESSSNPSEACSMLGYCISSSFIHLIENSQSVPLHILSLISPNSLTFTSRSMTTKLRLNELPTKTNSLACDECLKVMKPIHQILANKTCENLLLADVEKICANCPEHDKCVDVLQQHIKIYFDAVDHYSEPQLVCQHLGFCHANHSNRYNMIYRRISSRLFSSKLLDTNMNVQNSLTKSRVTNWKSEACYECQLITQFAQTFLFNATVEKNIIDFSKHEFCDPLTSHLERMACNDFVTHYGANIIKHFATNAFNTTRVCGQELKVCPSASTRHILPHLLGNHECTYGPGFWCKSEQNAKMCQATAYCANKAWNKGN